MAVSRETTDRVIATYKRAVEANRDIPVRKGNIVDLTAEVADEVMISADLHGNRQNFNRIMEIAELDAKPRRHLIMQEVCHGGPTYPSGTACMSHLMLDDVARLKADYPDRVHFLLSNHELSELTDYPVAKGGKMLNLLFRCGLQEMYGDRADQVRAAIREFLGSLPLAVRLSTGVFICHSLPEVADRNGFDPGVFERQLTKSDLSEGGDAFRLVWGRDYRQENADSFADLVGAELIITGHEPCDDGFQVPNLRQIIIDSCTDVGCYTILPLDEKLSQQEVVQRIRPLN